MPVLILLAVAAVWYWLSHKSVSPSGGGAASAAGGGLVSVAGQLAASLLNPAAPTQPGSTATGGIVSYLERQYEGLRLTPYPDGGGLSVGIGHHILAGETPSVITAAQANALFQSDLTSAANTVDQMVAVPLTGNQRSALTDFVFNMGAGNFAKSTLLTDLNAGQYDAAAAQLGNWIYSDGQPSEGLVYRRADETSLFYTPDAAGS